MKPDVAVGYRDGWLVQAVHVLRLDAQEERGRRPVPALGPLAGDLDMLLSHVDEVFRASL